MTKVIQLSVDVVRWTAFWIYIMGCAVAIWPFYVVRNFWRLMTGGGYFPLGVGLIALDQGIKQWAVAHLKDRPSPITLISGLLDLKYVENPGAAFGILRGQTHVFIIMALLTIVIILLYLSLVEHEEPIVRVALVLILAGAVGNLIDRVVLGRVIDYIHVFYKDWEWPIFNLADTIINVGVGLIFIDFLIDFFREDTQAETEGGAGAPA
jgi:signal peptidase II